MAETPSVAGSDPAPVPGLADDELAMSAEAAARQNVQQHWALPGGSHDIAMWRLKRVLPVLVALLAGFLLLAPFTHQQEVSFVLDKNKVDMAKERLKVVEALYRGEDSQGRPFSLRAGSAVQKSSRDPVVQLNNLEARIQLTGGGAVVTARQGQYNLSSDKVDVNGPVQFQTANGYRLTTSDVSVDLDQRTMNSRGAVEGRVPIGTFSADHLSADLDNRTITLSGRARLHIEQNGLKGR